MCGSLFGSPKPPKAPPPPAAPTPPPPVQQTQQAATPLPETPTPTPQSTEEVNKRPKVEAGTKGKERKRTSEGTGQLASTAAGTGVNTGTTAGLQGINTGAARVDKGKKGYVASGN